jgi:cytoskeletal protein CcmA (bactofilin family)
MKKLKGTIMITVVIIISTLSLLILTITSAVVGSYKKSVDILEKRDTSYAAEAYGETFMYYINRVAELALNYEVNYYFTQEGTLKHDVPGQVSLLLSPDYEPGNIFMNYINKVISKNQAWDMIKTGIEILLKDQCYKFFSDAGSFIGLTVNAGGPIYINRVSLLENYIKVLLQGKVSSRLESIQVEDWKLNPSNVLPDGYTFYITSTESSTGESKVKRVLRIDCEISFDKNNFDSGNMLSLNSPVANSIFDILNYALYTNGSFIANYNFAINGGNLFTGGNFTSHGGLQLNIENMVVKNNFHLGTTSNPLIFNDTITVRGITYIERNFERSGRTRKQLSLDMNKVFIGGNAYIKGKGEYIFKELFVKGNVELDGDVDQEANVAIENKALVAGDIIMTSYSQIVVKSGAELVCRNLYVMNSNNKIILENNSKLIVKSISNLSVVENRGGILSITNLDPSFDLPLVFKELENFKGSIINIGVVRKEKI